MSENLVILLEELKNRTLKIRAIANNALYFDDSSDYKKALWDILRVLDPSKFKDGGSPGLEFMEDDE